jgi:TPR repeat protein
VVVLTVFCFAAFPLYSDHRNKRPVLAKKFDIAQDCVNNSASLKQSADSGSAEAQFRYGRCLFDGHGVPQNVRDAVIYFKSSADQGNPDGQFEYG